MAIICNLCSHPVVVIEARDIKLIPAWCPNCGAFSDGRGGMKLPANREVTCKCTQVMASDSNRHFKGCSLRKEPS